MTGITPVAFTWQGSPFVRCQGMYECPHTARWCLVNLHKGAQSINIASASNASIQGLTGGMIISNVSVLDKGMGQTAFGTSKTMFKHQLHRGHPWDMDTGKARTLKGR